MYSEKSRVYDLFSGGGVYKWVPVYSTDTSDSQGKNANQVYYLLILLTYLKQHPSFPRYNNSLFGSPTK